MDVHKCRNAISLGNVPINADSDAVIIKLNAIKLQIGD